MWPQGRGMLMMVCGGYSWWGLGGDGVHGNLYLPLNFALNLTLLLNIFLKVKVILG